jgi:hypothetical protein
MILYCVVCYLIMLGMIVEDREQGDNKEVSWLSLLFAPLLVPIFIGMKIQEHR